MISSFHYSITKAPPPDSGRAGTKTSPIRLAIMRRSNGSRWEKWEAATVREYRRALPVPAPADFVAAGHEVRRQAGGGEQACRAASLFAVPRGWRGSNVSCSPANGTRPEPLRAVDGTQLAKLAHSEFVVCSFLSLPGVNIPCLSSAGSMTPPKGASERLLWQQNRGEILFVTCNSKNHSIEKKVSIHIGCNFCN
jgi:hypothetical protein